jgi:hypothetical protein
MIDAELLEELRRLVNALRSPGRWDSGDDWLRRSQEACPDDLMRQIVEDNRRGGDIHGRASAGPPPKAQQEPPRSNNGWVDPPKIRPPEGIEHVDRLVDMQDKLDAAARARQLGLSPEEWARLSEADLKARKEQQEKKQKGPKA